MQLNFHLGLDFMWQFAAILLTCAVNAGFTPLESWIRVSTSLWLNLHYWFETSVSCVLRAFISMPISCRRAQLVGGSLISPHALWLSHHRLALGVYIPKSSLISHYIHITKQIQTIRFLSSVLFSAVFFVHTSWWFDIWFCTVRKTLR